MLSQSKNISCLTFLIPAAVSVACTSSPVESASAKIESSPQEAPVIRKATGGTTLALGSAPPMSNVMMRNVDGNQVSIDSIAGEKGTLVIFTCNHCPYSVAWEERIASLGNEYSKKGFGVISVNPNDPETYPIDDFAPMQERAKKLGLEFPYTVDATSDIARAFGATKTPEVFLFDASKKLVYHGAVDDSTKAEDVKERYLQDAMDAILTSAPIQKAKTKAIGCSIKFRS